MTTVKRQPKRKQYILPIVFYARLVVEAANKKSAEKVLAAFFDRYYSGLAEDGSFIPNGPDMNKFRFESYERMVVVEW